MQDYLGDEKDGLFLKVFASSPPESGPAAVYIRKEGERRGLCIYFDNSSVARV